MPSARAAKVSAMRCCSTGSASAFDIVDRRREAAIIKRAGAGAQRQRLAGARAGTPGDVLVGFGIALAGTRRADQLEDRLDDAFGHRHAADQVLDFLQPLGVEHVLGLGILDAGGFEQDAALGVEFRDRGCRSASGSGRAALPAADRCLPARAGSASRAHGRAGQIVAGAGDGDVILLHRLQQRRLGARAGAVDLVGHQQLREDRAGNEAEASACRARPAPSPRSRECRTASGRA